MRHGEVVARGREDAPPDLGTSAQERKGVLLVGLGIDDFVVLAQDHAGGAGAPARPDAAPGVVLAHQRGLADRAHEGRYEASVVGQHPAHVAHDAPLEPICGLLGLRRLNFRGRHADRVRCAVLMLVLVLGAVALPLGFFRSHGPPVAAFLTLGPVRGRQERLGLAFLLLLLLLARPLGGSASDGLLQLPPGEGGEDALRDQAGGEDEPGDGTEALLADHAGGGEQDQAPDGGRERGGKVDGDAAAERVAGQVEAAGATVHPRQGGRSEGAQSLRDVQPRIVGQVADTVGEAAAEQVKEHDAVATGGQAVGELGQRLARGGDAVDEEYLAAGRGAELVYSHGSILL